MEAEQTFLTGNPADRIGIDHMPFDALYCHFAPYPDSQSSILFLHLLN
ncbi:hypothetical protein BN1095_5050002 [Clostridioides difficile]|uniref:Uncharacterized protein n=1 Tax=Clostridioides difficile TaxID=1496 RepID=A0A069AW31_CLODI|nr:hypothetical protein BN1095_5050002 [Clostridioides difficile]